VSPAVDKPSPEAGAPRRRIPPWLRVAVPIGHAYHDTAAELRRAGVATVCEEARCPNVGDCWSRHTATVMLMGEICTRGCRFCSVKTSARPPALDPNEPARVAALARRLGWRYVVLTSVDRDDLPDGGAAHYAEAVRRLREELPAAHVEVLIPDFGGSHASLALVLDAGAHVLGHNLETVRRLTPVIRDARASYERSLELLRRAGGHRPRPLVKSSLMAGLGEARAELSEAMRDLRAAGVDILALGQYLQPGKRQASVARYLPPDEFDVLAAEARELGFEEVTAGPLVRSSYHSEEFASRLIKETRAATGGPDDG
jgi:lipoyl synthase